MSCLVNFESDNEIIVLDKHSILLLRIKSLSEVNEGPKC